MAPRKKQLGDGNQAEGAGKGSSHLPELLIPFLGMRRTWDKTNLAANTRGRILENNNINSAICFFPLLFLVHSLPKNKAPLSTSLSAVLRKWRVSNTALAGYGAGWEGCSLCLSLFVAITTMLSTCAASSWPP